MTEPLYVSTHPAVIAVVDHFVSVGFDPSYADYDEVAQTVLEGLAKAGFELLSPVQNESLPVAGGSAEADSS